MQGDKAPKPVLRPRFVVRLADGIDDQDRVQGLRRLVFRRNAASDRDWMDARCDHVMIQTQDTGTLVCCFRLLSLSGGAALNASYAGQFYDLTRLAAYPGAMLEVGRFCLDPQWRDPDILRLAWGAITHRVDHDRVRLLFGCSSFRDARPDAHRDALAYLAAYHAAPAQWAPAQKSPQVVPLHRPDPAPPPVPPRSLPPLLRGYLHMGGWVSDHAVIDPDLDTLHVFTGLETHAIPQARAKVLRSIAARISAP